MDDLVEGIRNTAFLDRPIRNDTGLSGTYNITLTFTPQNRPVESGVSLFKALPEQLGLKLEPRKVAVEVLIIDHIEKPSEN